MLKNELYEEIEITTVSQYGDTFIFHAACPACLEEMFIGFDAERCPHCLHDILNAPRNIQRGFRRLVAGSVRKPGLVTKKLVRALRDMQENKCFYCFVCLDHTGMHVEHKVPLAMGGTNKQHNLVLSCPTCNALAGAKYFATEQGKRNYILSKRNIIKT